MKFKLHDYFKYSKSLSLIPCLALGLALLPSLPSKASESSLNILEVPVLQVNIPDLPPLKNPRSYLYSADEVFSIRLVLSLGQKQVKVYDRDELIATFPVAVGKQGWETPTGEFTIRHLVANPHWENPWTGKVIPPGPNNPLGDRWIGFWTDGRNDIGFHGTPGEHLIGQAVSHGCVRMKNSDIRKLFEMVSVGTPVIVVK